MYLYKTLEKGDYQSFQAAKAMEDMGISVFSIFEDKEGNWHIYGKSKRKFSYEEFTKQIMNHLYGPGKRRGNKWTMIKKRLLTKL